MPLTRAHLNELVAARDAIESGEVCGLDAAVRAEDALRALSLGHALGGSLRASAVAAVAVAVEELTLCKHIT